MIAASARRPESELDTDFALAAPKAFGAVLTLLSEVLRVMPDVLPRELPRLADFGRIAAAVDHVVGTDSLKRFLEHRSQLVAVAAADDPVGAAVLKVVARGPWSGTATELLTEITPQRPPRDWPRTAAVLGARLKRLAVGLGIAGVKVEQWREGQDGSRKIRLSLAVSGVRLSEPDVPEVVADSSDGGHADTVGALSAIDEGEGRRSDSSDGTDSRLRRSPSSGPANPSAANTTHAAADRQEI